MKRIILFSILGLLVVGGLLFALSIVLTFSEGYRAGTVMKMSRKGVLFKTNEGQLNTGGGFSSDGDVTSSIWNFSVAPGDEEVLRDIEKAVDGQYRVKLYYGEKFFTWKFRGDTKYFVTKVEEVGSTVRSGTRAPQSTSQPQSQGTPQGTTAPQGQPAGGN